MRHRSALALFPLLLVLLLGGGSPAGAQSPCPPGGASPQYPPQACSLALGTSQVRPGDPLPVSGTGFRPGSTVTVALDANRVLGSAPVGSGGTFSTTVIVPADASPGTHTITATGVDPAGQTRVLSATLTVLGATSGADLPRTGAALAVPAGVAGTVLVGVGSVAVLAARRRRIA